jgi:sirohydrochlorin ferrochelatase
MLEEVARLFAQRFASTYEIVEPAHMELTEPSIATAYDRCVGRGATRVVVCPFFLGPGKHWTSDIRSSPPPPPPSTPAANITSHSRLASTT